MTPRLHLMFFCLPAFSLSFLFVFKICAPALHSSKCAAAPRQLGIKTLSPMESKHDVKWQRRILKNLNDCLIKNLCELETHLTAFFSPRSSSGIIFSCFTNIVCISCVQINQSINQSIYLSIYLSVCICDSVCEHRFIRQHPQWSHAVIICFNHFSRTGAKNL